MCFRDYTRRQAQQLGLLGWVRNMPDGSVEALVSGRDSEVESMVEWFHDGPPSAVVSAVQADEVAASEDLSRFEIRY